MIKILSGNKTAVNLHKLLIENGIKSEFYFFDKEFGEKKVGGKKIRDFDLGKITKEDKGNIIISSEKAFVFFKNELKDIYKNHYFLKNKENYKNIANSLNVHSIGVYSEGATQFPVFVKPKQSGEGIVPFKTKIIHNKDELIKNSKYIDNCTIQTYLDPADYEQIAIAGFFTGTVNSLISVKQLNQYPRGVASYVSLYSDPHTEVLKKNISSFLNAISYKGFIEFEFKRKRKSGKIYLMDINPRPWGWFYYYLSAIRNFREVFLSGKTPDLQLKKAWVNLPRLVLSNLYGRFDNPSIPDLFSNKICYEPYF